MSALAFCALAVAARAHQLWIGANNYVLSYPGPRPGAVATTAYVTFGHKLPIDDTLDDERFGGLYLVSGDKPARKLDTAPTGYRSASLTFEAAGAHWLSSVNKPIFSTQMKDDKGVVTYARVPKTEAPKTGGRVVDATQIHGFAKTLLFVRGEGVAAKADALAAKPLGHTLEIVPAKNPSALAKGETLSVQVHFRGRPYKEESIELIAEHIAGAYVGKPAKWIGRTDNQGRVEVPLALAGPWQLMVTVLDAPPEDIKGKADQVRYRATLVFEVPGADYSQ